MRILLTGSSGYIGSTLIAPLKELGHYVVGVDRVPDSSGLLDDFVEGDLTDPAVAKGAVKGIDLVLHLAAAKGDWGISADEFYRDNVAATQVLLKAGRERGIKNWFFYSTVATMGPSEVPLDETAPFSPAIPYGASKAEAEALFLAFSEEDPDARIMILRPSAVFGARNPDNTNIYRLIEALHRDRFVMVGPGEALKTTSYIQNVVEVTLFLIDHLRPGLQTYIYVDEPILSMAELVRGICDLLGKPPPRWHVPLKLVQSVAKVFDGVAALAKVDLPITAARIKKFNTSTNFDAGAIRRLGFRQPVRLDDALKATVDWHLGVYAKTGQLRETMEAQAK